MCAGLYFYTCYHVSGSKRVLIRFSMVLKFNVLGTITLKKSFSTFSIVFPDVKKTTLELDIYGEIYEK